MLYNIRYTYKGEQFKFLGTMAEFENMNTKTGGFCVVFSKEPAVHLTDIGMHAQKAKSLQDNPFGQENLDLHQIWEENFMGYQDCVASERNGYVGYDNWIDE